MRKVVQWCVSALGLAAGLGLSLFATAASAVPPDFSDLTDAVDFSTATAAILLIFAGLAGVYILWKGAKLIISAVRGG